MQTFAYEDIDLGETIQYVSNFFHVPSLRICEMKYRHKGPMKNASRLFEWTCPLRASTITTLDLTDCCFGTRAITTLIDSCATLKHFRYVQGQSLEPYIFPNFAYLWLILYKDTLESLTMHLGAGMWGRLGKNIGLDGDLGGGDVSLGPRHEFSKLRVVNVCRADADHYFIGVRSGVPGIYSLFSS